MFAFILAYSSTTKLVCFYKKSGCLRATQRYIAGNCLSTAVNGANCRSEHLNTDNATDCVQNKAV
jgi:hypothetical protein